MIGYADSSFLVSLIVRDAFSPLAIALLDEGAVLLLTPLHRVEVANAVALRVFRREASAGEAMRALRVFEANQATEAFEPREWPGQAWEAAANLSRRYSPRLGVRTLDVLHVAAAISLRAEAFYSFDRRQRRLADGAGLSLRPARLRSGRTNP